MRNQTNKYENLRNLFFIYVIIYVSQDLKNAHIKKERPKTDLENRPNRKFEKQKRS